MLYFDHAATSWPKPPEVRTAVLRALDDCGNPGRSSYGMSMRAAEMIYGCRAAAAKFFGSGSPERVIFTPNATHALNVAIHGLLKPGDGALISCREHNAVLRPLYALSERGVRYDIFHTAAECAGLIKPDTKAVICAHASNLTGRALPIRALGALAHSRGLYMVVDAAQSAGHLPVNLLEDNIDILCVPGHKGLLGPMGSGMLIASESFDLSALECLTQGGTGTLSLDPAMPPDPPERFESGTLSVPAIAGLRAALGFIGERGIDYINEPGRRLRAAVLERLREFRRVRLYDVQPEPCAPILLFNVEGMESEEVCALLGGGDEEICTRAGYHCSPLGHTELGTLEHGAVRLSFGYGNDIRQADVFWKRMREILG